MDSPHRLAPGLVLASCVWLFGACASAGHLAEYEFRDRSLATVTLAPPNPDIFSEGVRWESGGEWWQEMIRVGAEVASNVQSQRIREKLHEASEAVDVAALMSDRVLHQSARLLRATPVVTVQEADYEIETRIKNYGIQAGSWDDAASFFVDADVVLLDSDSGRRIWDAHVQARDHVNPAQWGSTGPLGDVITAAALARLSVEEIQQALGALAEYAADAVTDKLAGGLEKAGKR
jgi:hypothetical protein